MTLDEIEELTTLLEGENPESHGEWLRLRADAIICLHWLDSNINNGSVHVGMPVYKRLYERLMLVYNRSLIGIGTYVAKPRLCLNAS